MASGDRIALASGHVACENRETSPETDPSEFAGKHPS